MSSETHLGIDCKKCERGIADAKSGYCGACVHNAMVDLQAENDRIRPVVQDILDTTLPKMDNELPWKTASISITREQVYALKALLEKLL